MGDWCATYHWFECPTDGSARQVLARLRAAARRRSLDFGRWAMRAGRLAPALVQAETVSKYGADTELAAFVQAEVPAARALQLCHGYGLVRADPRPGALVPAWNYMLARTGDDLREVAALLGAATPAPGVLCLRAPLPLTARRPATLVGPALDGDWLAEVGAALLVGCPALAGSRPAELVLGLHTAHGWTHLARLELWPDRRPAEAGLALDGGAYNPCAFELAIGPFAHSNHVERLPPVPAPRIEWPFARG